jgi:hypothetical protein
MKKILASAVVFLLLSANVFSQENSPYTRYILGDIVSGAPVSTNGMGGISATYYDFTGINAINPATYGFSRKMIGKKGEGGLVTFDIGLDASSRTIKEVSTNKKFKSNYAILDYINIGLPLKKGWGVNIGFAPETRINYKVFYRERLLNDQNGNIDSAKTTYSGNGGTYKVFIGSGWAHKNFGFGLNFGYLFGTRETATRRDFINDSVIYFTDDYSSNTTFGNIFVTLGLHQSFQLHKTARESAKKLPMWLRLGAYAQLQPELNASQDYKRFSNYTSSSGGFLIDTIAYKEGISGKIKYPYTFGMGVMLEETASWLAGVDLVLTNWDNYRFYGQKDYAANTYKIKIGTQFMGKAYRSMNAKDRKGFFKTMIYRAGFNYGTEPYNFNGNQLKQVAGTFGLGIPLMNRQNNFVYRQQTMMNISLEFGSRGKATDALKENFFRIGLGISLSDIWFQKAKYY